MSEVSAPCRASQRLTLDLFRPCAHGGRGSVHVRNEWVWDDPIRIECAPDLQLERSWPEHQRPHVGLDRGGVFVYLLGCEHHRLLYVGQTVDVRQRFAQHRARPWWADVDHVTILRAPSLRQALDYELQFIHGALPVHNVVGVRG